MFSPSACHLSSWTTPENLRMSQTSLGACQPQTEVTSKGVTLCKWGNYSMPPA